MVKYIFSITENNNSNNECIQIIIKTNVLALWYKTCNNLIANNNII